MTRRILLIAIVVSMTALLAPSGASADRVWELRDQPVRVTFQMRVYGVPTPGTTFWVAYGPVAGKFAVVRLRAGGHGRFAALGRLPAHGRVDLVYLAANGVLHTRFGSAPRDPVTIIRRISCFVAVRQTSTLVTWQAPIG